MTQSLAAHDVSTVVDRYFAMWNEADPARRRALIDSTWTSDASYLDPLYSAEGADALDALVAGAHQQYPGYAFTQIGTLDVHHDRARWAWEFASAREGKVLMRGVDFALLAPDSRLRSVTGFFDPPTA